MSVVKALLKQSQSSKLTKINITPLIDAMTILVVFLLKSMDSSAIKLPPEELRLPASATGADPKEALLVQVSPKYIIVNDKVVAELVDGKLKASDVAKTDLYLIPALEKELMAEAEKSKLIEKETNALIKFTGTMFVQADKSLDYATLKRVLYTSSVAGYGDLQLATIGE
ncbi:MAG: biopolymer transporter ExbD [Bdellovibrionaceae bacterium]|nr:biopolymer transporter ExbD [Pseudobdellovibrionaceae bacterium]